MGVFLLKLMDDIADRVHMTSTTAIKGIRDAIEIIKEKSITVLVGLGGGSPIDASKAIAYYVQQETGSAFIPQVAIPTTLSAAEFTM